VRAGFPSLKVATLDLSSGEYSVEQNRDWPLQLAAFSLPLSVHTLRCTAEARGDPEDAPDLHAVLAMAAGNIEDGVGLKTLFADHCTTDVHHLYDIVEVQDDEEDIDLEPTEEEVAAAYTPAARSLDGLLRLELANSSCSQEVLDAVVAAAPDLRDLEMDWHPAHDEVYTMQSTRRVQCSGLEKLTVRVSLDGRNTNEQAALMVQLMDSCSLRTCSIKVEDVVRAGDRVMVALECCALEDCCVGVNVLASACWEPHDYCEGQRQWHLRCSYEAERVPDTGSSHEREQQVAVSFEWGPDQACIISREAWQSQEAS
jgi:hypothetical protein